MFNQSQICFEDSFFRYEDGIICNLCPHFCFIKDGFSGKCKIRKNKNSKLFLSNYSEIVCAKIDKLKDRPLYSYSSKNCENGRDSKTLSIGLTGCNNFCPFCQNYKISQYEKYSDSFILNPKDIYKFAIENEVTAVSFTFSEPIVWIEFLLDCISEIKSNTNKIDFILKTAGYINPVHTEKLLKNINAINLDIKPLKKEYLQRCGIQEHYYIENFLEEAYRSTHLEISHIIIEGLNDSEYMMEKFSQILVKRSSKDITIHLLPHYPAWKSKFPVTEKNTILKCKKYLENFGFKNIHCLIGD